LQQLLQRLQLSEYKVTKILQNLKSLRNNYWLTYQNFTTYTAGLSGLMVGCDVRDPNMKSHR